jgi:serine/threonine protein kinase
MIFDLCNGGDLEMLLNAKGRLSEIEARHIIMQIIEGLYCLYRAHIVHRDIKAANIFLHFPEYPHLVDMTLEQKMEFLSKINILEVNMQLKIGDFDFAKYLQSRNQAFRHSNLGTPLYMAP